MSARPMRIVSLESRRADEMARLIERHGGTPIVAPSMREVPLEDQTDARAFADVLIGGGVDVLVLLTGVGFRMLVDAMATRLPRRQIVEALDRLTLVCRGPKPVAVLKEMGLKPAAVAPEPNTWRELLEVLDSEVEVLGKRVGVQEYGQRNAELLDELERRGAEVTAVPVYGWTMPVDAEPLERAMRAMCEGEADAVMFTSRQQVENLMQTARAAGRDLELIAALADRVLVVSVGPVTTEALEAHSIAVDLHPPHPKMGQMVTTTAREGWRRLDEKRKRSETSRP